VSCLRFRNPLYRVNTVSFAASDRATTVHAPLGIGLPVALRRALHAPSRNAVSALADYLLPPCDAFGLVNRTSGQFGTLAAISSGAAAAS
jgi:hypothetical protein